MASMSARGVALAALGEWRRGKHFADAIIQRALTDSSLGGADRAFATELFYGVLRHLTLLDFWIDQLRSDSLGHDSRDLLRLGIYQLFCLRTPGHAAVYETVELANRKNRSLINAILRTALRKFAELEAAATAEALAVRQSHPQFLIDRWTAQYGADAATALCEWNNQPAPLYARVNRLRLTVEQFLTAEPESTRVPERNNFVRLSAVPADALARGACYIQDPSTSIAAELLDPQPGETVLDACAAPGGKSGMIAEMMQNRGQLFACDRDPKRVEILQRNLETLGLTSARTFVRDWRSPNEAIPLGSCDRILVDAPCSNTGVMRRRVDVRWRLTPRDFEHLPNEQLTIVRAVLPLLKPGGTLVYSTCSLEREENETVVARLLDEFPFLQLTAERSALPFRDHFDGAFAARLERAV